MKEWGGEAAVLRLLCTDRDMVRLWPDGGRSVKDTSISLMFRKGLSISHDGMATAAIPFQGGDVTGYLVGHMYGKHGAVDKTSTLWKAPRTLATEGIRRSVVSGKMTVEAIGLVRDMQGWLIR